MDKDYARKALAALLTEGQFLYALPLRTSLNHRTVMLLIALSDRTIRDISPQVAILLGLRFDRLRGGLYLDRAAEGVEIQLTKAISQAVFGKPNAIGIWYL